MTESALPWHLETGGSDAVDYNPVSAATLADPFSAYAQLRERCPVHRFTGFGRPLYSVARRTDVHAMLTDTDTWSNRGGPGVSDADPNPDSLQQFDPPDHGIRRRFFLEGFQPGADRAVDAVGAVAHSLVDDFEEAGSAELRDAYATRLPVISFADILGLPLSDCQRFMRWAELLAARMGEPDLAAEKWEELRDHTAQVVAQRRVQAPPGAQRPGDGPVGTLVPPGLLSHLCCRPMEDGTFLTDGEVAAMVAMTLMGGHEPTAALITSLVWRGLSSPGQWRQLGQHSDLVPVAVEESLRYDPPVLGNCRTNNCTTELGGFTIPAGSKVMYLLGSANRDNEQVESPDEFHIDRPLSEARRHYSFGHGPHVCPGASLARRRACVAVEVLLDRLPGLRLAGDAQRLRQPFMWGRRTLPVAWE